MTNTVCVAIPDSIDIRYRYCIVKIKLNTFDTIRSEIFSIETKRVVQLCNVEIKNSEKLKFSVYSAGT